MRKIMVFLISLCVLIFPNASYAVFYIPANDTSIVSITNLEYLGSSITNLGDTDGDYYPNIAFGAPRYASSAGYGAIYIPTIDAGGFKPSLDLTTIGSTSPGLWITGSYPPSNMGAYIGEGIVSLGDLNNDKLNDTAITRRLTSSIEILYGSKLLSGKKNLSELSSLTSIIEITNIDSINISIASGDFMGDNKKDLIIAYGQSGKIAAIDVSKLVPGTYTLASLLDGVRGISFEVNYSSVSVNRISLIDTKRSGKKDIVAVNSTGNVVIIPNKAIYPASSIVNDAWLAANGGTRISNTKAKAVYYIGDSNCDGIDDIALRTEPSYNKFEIRIVYGRSVWPSAIDITSELSDATKGFTIKGLGSALYDLVNMAPAGDRNSDGCKDFLVGDFAFQSGDGRVIYFNSRSNWGTSFDMSNMENAFGMQYFGQRKSYFGSSMIYAENLLGGYGCSLDASIIVSEPGFGNIQGKSYIIPVK